MLGFRSRDADKAHESDDRTGDVAKLFFDTFSSRIGKAEEVLQNMSSEFEKLKLSIERSQISDLVLLERLQRAERLMGESLLSIRTTIERVSLMDEKPVVAQRSEVKGVGTLGRSESVAIPHPVIASHILSPTGEFGSLPSITTPTELQVLTLLANEGPKSAPEIGRAVGRSREHTARLMKKLFEEGYIRRDQTRIPFRYSVVDRLIQSVRKVEAKAEDQEVVSVPPN